MQNGKIIIFGAGRIGRAFIGQLFSYGGYEVVFIDVDRQLINELNQRNNYSVVIKSETEQVINIKNVRGIYASDKNEVARELSSAGIAAVSVGINGLSTVIPLVAKGLILRYHADRNCPLDIIIAENMRNAEDYFRKVLLRYLPGTYPFDMLVGLFETSIGKMCPIMTREDTENDILQVLTEPYNTLITNKKNFKNYIPPFEDLAPKDNIKAWIDRSLFIHNPGHPVATYLGCLYNPGLTSLSGQKMNSHSSLRRSFKYRLL